MNMNIKKDWKVSILDALNNPIITYFPDGNIMRVEYKYKNKYHNEFGPAYIQWYKNGTKMRENYYINGMLSSKHYNYSGPSVIEWYDDGNIYYKKYHMNGILTSGINKKNYVMKWYRDKIRCYEYLNSGRLIKKYIEKK